MRVSFTCCLAAALILTTPGARTADAQQTIIRGRVAESGSARPVSGVRVSAGTSAADTTAVNGDYRIVVPSAPASIRIRVTKIGFVPTERMVNAGRGGSAVANFEIEKRPLGLDAVVVTGSAGATAVREIGHSIAQIRPADLSEPILSVDHLLAAKVPGLSVIPSTGMAGSGAKIRLRGSASVALSNQPLVYVDGVRIRSDGYPENLPLIGERSRGPNDTPSPLNDIDPSDIERVEIVRGPAATTLYGTEAAAGVIQIFTKRGNSGRTVWSSQLDAGISSVRPFGTRDEPYMRLNPWLRNAMRTGYSLSTSGGNDVRYHLSTSYHRSEGVLPNDLEKRLTVRGNFDLHPVKKLALAWSSALTINKISNTPAGPNGQGLTQNAYRGPANATGVEGKESLDRILAWEISTDLNHAMGGLTAVFTPTRSTSHTVTIGYDRAESEMRSLRPYGFVFAPQGILSNERWLSSTTTADYLGKTRIGLGSSLAASMAWGAQSIGTDVSTVAGYAEGFAGPAAPTLSSGALTLSGENRMRAIIAGAFSQATLSYRDRLFVTGGLRVDGSSSFGRDFGLQPFPRVSASYVISEESFWPRSLGTLRLRSAYGQAGRAPRVFDADRTWTQAGYDGKPAFLPLSIGNSRLGPERSAETEIGFDASRSDDRLRAELTVYRRTTSEALLPVSQPPSLGFLNPQLENVGTMRISGLELALTGRFGGAGWASLGAGLDLALNRTKAVDLGETPAFVVDEVAWIRQGDPTPVLIGVRLRNPNEIAEPDTEQNHVFGPNMPTRIVGTHAALRFRGGSEFAARIEYQGGNYMYDNASRALFSQGVHPLCNNAYDLIKQGDPARLTAWERVYCNPQIIPADGAIVPGDFVRLRDLSVTLPFPGALMRSRSATLIFAARNYLLWKNSELKVFDPEMSGRDGMFAPVRAIEFGVPTPASLSVSIRATYW